MYAKSEDTVFSKCIMVEVLGSFFKTEIQITYHEIYQCDCTYHQFLIHFYFPWNMEHFSMEKETSLHFSCSARGPHLTCWWQIKDQITIMKTCVLMNSALFCIIFSWAGSITADTFSTSGYFYGTSLTLPSQIPNIDIWALASLIGGGKGILLCGPHSHSITSTAGPHCWSTLLVQIPGRQCWPTILVHTAGPDCFVFPVHAFQLPTFLW